MKPELKYIELKTGCRHRGPAWIGMVELSKSGRTVYFNGSAFKSIGGRGISGNYIEFGSGDEYWISGVKKNGADRHWVGGGKIMIDKKVVDHYLSVVDADVLDDKKFQLTDIIKTDKQKFTQIENEKWKEL